MYGANLWLDLLIGCKPMARGYLLFMFIWAGYWFGMKWMFRCWFGTICQAIIQHGARWLRVAFFHLFSLWLIGEVSVRSFSYHKNLIFSVIFKYHFLFPQTSPTCRIHKPFFSTGNIWSTVVITFWGCFSGKFIFFSRTQNKFARKLCGSSWSLFLSLLILPYPSS